MFGNNSVDDLAKVILTDVMGGVVSPDMLKRFHRQGRRDAKRFRFEPSREYVIHAVALATSKICEDYVAEREAVLDRRAALSGEIEQVRGTMDRVSPELKPVGDLQGVPSGAVETTPGSLERLAEIRKHQRQQRALEEQRAAVNRVADLTRQLKSIDDRLVSLPDQYKQAAASCKEVGNLLWARYCMGFERGKRKRLSPDDTLDGPPSELEFESPCTFLTVTPQAATERTT